MKKLIALLLALVLALSMAACGESESSTPKKKKPTKSETTATEKTDDDSTKATSAAGKEEGITESTAPKTEYEEGGSATVPTAPGGEESKEPDDFAIPPLPVNVKDLPAATIKTINGNITKTKQVDSYTYQPARDGRYTFELSEVRADVVLKLAIYDHLGQRVADDSYAVNGDYLAVDLKKGETYTYKVTQSSNTGSYVLTIGEQTETVDISAFSAINDSVTFTKQINNYTFVPERDGRYTFTLSEVRASIVLQIYVYNRLGEKVTDDTHAINGDSVVCDLKGGDAYTIEIRQSSDCGTYTLGLGKQKAAVNMTVGKNLQDSVEFYKQINTYTFTATETAHSLELKNLASGTVLAAYVYDYLDAKVADDTHYINGDTVYMSNLIVGKTYRIEIVQSTNFGGYMLNLQ